MEIGFSESFIFLAVKFVNLRAVLQKGNQDRLSNDIADIFIFIK